MSRTQMIYIYIYIKGVSVRTLKMKKLGIRLGMGQ